MWAVLFALAVFYFLRRRRIRGRVARVLDAKRRLRELDTLIELQLKTLELDGHPPLVVHFLRTEKLLETLPDHEKGEFRERLETFRAAYESLSGGSILYTWRQAVVLTESYVIPGPQGGEGRGLALFWANVVDDLLAAAEAVAPEIRRLSDEYKTVFFGAVPFYRGIPPRLRHVVASA